jgi:hypothetical protein
MTWKTNGVGCLAAIFLAALLTTGCADDSELISSGNVVATMPTTAINPTSIDYQCIQVKYTSMEVRAFDGICSAASDRPGEACGDDFDCSLVDASCDQVFGMYCDGGANSLQSCATAVDCPGGSCGLAGECVTPPHMATGQACFTSSDCDLPNGEICGGSCSATSPTPGQPCIEDSDCSTSDCVGAEANDALGDSPIRVLPVADDLNPVAYFTTTCPTCELQVNTPKYCVSDSDCSNPCLPGGPPGSFCPTGLSCCAHRTNPEDQVTPVCATDADCPTNHCVDVATPLPSVVFPEGKYRTTELRLEQLLLFAPGAARVLTACPLDINIVPQYTAAPLDFVVGPNQSNTIRSVMDVAALEGLLGLGPAAANCTSARANFPQWFGITSN